MQLRLRKDRRARGGEADQTVDEGDADILDAVALEFGHYPEPEARALRLLDPEPEHVLVAVAIDAQRQVGGWSSQPLVDTAPTWRMRGLEPLGTYTAQMAMAPGRVVEVFDVRPDVREGELSARIDVFLDPLLLQAAEEGLGDGVIPALPLRLMLGTR